jgi:uroporphyrinogen-III synthase
LLGVRDQRKLRLLLDGVRMSSIGPVTSTTLRASGLSVDIAAEEFTIPGLVAAIVAAISPRSATP